MADHRPDVYFSEARGKYTFRASSLSRCIQSLVAAGLNHERMSPPGFMQKAWDEGTHGEARVLQLFRDGGLGWHPQSPMLKPEADAITCRFKGLDPRDPASYHGGKDSPDNFPHVAHEFLQSDQIESDTDPQFVLEIPVGNKALIRGHLDEIVECFQGPIATADEWHGHRFVVEAKLFGVDYFKKMLRKGLADPGFIGYAWQLSLYMHGTGLPGFFVVGEKKRWEKGEEREKDTPEHQRYDLDQVLVTMFDEPPIGLGVIKAKVLRLVRMIEAGELPACDMTQYPCDYYYLCSDKKDIVEVGVVKDKPEVPVVVLLGEQATKVELMAANYEGAKMTEKSAVEAAKLAKKKLEEALTEAGLDKDKPVVFEAGGKVVEWQVQERAAEKEPRKGYTVRMPKVRTKEMDE